MFKDIKVSNDINEKFKNVARNNLNNTTLAGKTFFIFFYKTNLSIFS
jgi:hypothetical protein